MEFAELKTLTELSVKLTTVDITHIQNLIGIPEGLCEEILEGTNFLFALKRWNKHNPYNFYQALLDTKPDLIALACKVPWLCVSSQSEVELQENEMTIKSLIELLKNELKKGQWQLIYMVVTNEAVDNVGFEMTLNKLLERGYIHKGLNQLSEIMESIQRSDLVVKLRTYIRIFANMEEGEFESKFKREVNNQAKEMLQWEKQLKEFLQIQYGTVQEIMGSDTTANLADVYIDLTILKDKPKEIKLEDETTYNEIAMLRRMAEEGGWRHPVDFTEELLTFEQTKPEIWCLIGNPGCGKTFLAKRTALRFSSSELVGIKYTISIPCRNTDWHTMESTRYEEELEIATEYISKWLCLGLPKGPNWSKDLAKHLTESDGEGLLLIIDGLDEFTRKVPFGKTFLCLLLTRQSLTKSTIILTSRPGAWTDISSVHELKIDRYYQVLGFSPENRDLYFKRQITNETKLKACWDLMERHDEMKQLSLIPVNASLFAALLKGEDSTSINTLSKLYYELTLYMIRRELSRMGLQEFSRVALISDLHTDIRECLKAIGFIAFLGVANRDLASEENVPLIMGQEEYPSNCLGLAHEHYKKEAVGLIKKVWTFAHLTMQEFTAAHWLSTSTWTEQCYSIRYISHSSESFSLFKMLVRFLCGILSHKSAAILSIMYRYLTPQPISMIGMPMGYLLIRKPYVPQDLIPYTGLKDFAKINFQLTSMLFESNAKSIPNWFKHFTQFLPSTLYLYISEAVSPNEWSCFLQSLQFLSQIQFIHFFTEYINPIQFKCLLEEMRNCFINYLAISFFNKDSTTVLEYTNLIRDTEFCFDTKISMELSDCYMSDTTAVELFSPTTIQNLSCINLRNTVLSNEFLKALSNQLTALDCIVLPNWYKEEVYSAYSLLPINYEILLPSLCQATQLRVLHLNGFPEEYDLYLRAMLPNFSNLQEIQLADYSQLTALPNLSSLTYLQIGDDEGEMKQTDSNTLYINLLQIIIDNRHTLRAVRLYDLEFSGLRSCSIFLNVLSLCTKLIVLEMRDIYLPADDTSLWSIFINDLKLLVVLELSYVSLYDTGLQSLCAGLAYHTNIRKLDVSYDELTSLSCDTLIQLIPTITQLEKLVVSDLYDLRRQDEEASKLLKQTADEYSIKLVLL